MTRIWIDTDIGTNPDDATAILFALKHPEIDVVGFSICGTQQEKRLDQLIALLDYAGASELPAFLGKDIDADIINEVSVQHTVAIGPLTNISRLVLDEVLLGKLHIMGGALRSVTYRGKDVTRETNATTDQEATRIVLTQYRDVCISALDATSSLVLDGPYLEKIESAHPFLKARYEGYRAHLEEKYGAENAQIVLHDVLPVCDILNTATITREVIEFYIQPDGSFRPAYPLSSVSTPIEEIIDNPDELPVPLVTHEVIRTVSPHRIVEEVVKILG